MQRVFILFILFFLSMEGASGQHSIARQWNEVLLEAIRDDFARPTIHARNLFHASVIAYDSWALFDCISETVFLGKTFGGYTCDYDELAAPDDITGAQEEVLSYAMFRLLNHRFATSPGAQESLERFDTLFRSYGFDPEFTSVDYSMGSFAALGNYLGQQMIRFGLQDGSNEQQQYRNQFYTPVNSALVLQEYEENIDIDPNRWQPLSFDLFVDQSGNTVPIAIPPFLGPEWGAVTPFALKSEDRFVLNNGFDSYLYTNPGPPPAIQNSQGNGLDDPYKWNFALVASWSSHLDPNDPTLIDISPGALGNVEITDYPQTFEEYKSFYNFENGGDIGRGHMLNPATNLPYEPQWVKRGDYARVLAEFWADGPDSETPPGHWFTILNYVSDHPKTIKKFKGEGEELDNLEWDVKSYLALAGAMHDSAICTWGIKGYFDYVRPISAIRYMSAKGQSSNTSLQSYDPHGIPLVDGLVELIEMGDPLAEEADENIGKIKIRAWKGPDFIDSLATNAASVDWILGTHWWPYQRGTFVTPPFAGYVSGHSTFSRAAAEVLTLVTGDIFFPGGMGTFDAPKNEFLVFEAGPSESLTLQWATYRDASDQTSLSRIWGGIHPPIDDIPGRLIGEQIGKNAFAAAEEYFNGAENSALCENQKSSILYPVPFSGNVTLNTSYKGIIEFILFGLDGKQVYKNWYTITNTTTNIDLPEITTGLYIVKILDETKKVLLSAKVLKESK